MTMQLWLAALVLTAWGGEVRETFIPWSCETRELPRADDCLGKGHRRLGELGCVVQEASSVCVIRSFPPAPDFWSCSAQRADCAPTVAAACPAGERAIPLSTEDERFFGGTKRFCIREPTRRSTTGGPAGPPSPAAREAH